jgi:hypothetical protein
MNRRIAMTIALGKFTKDEKDLFDIMLLSSLSLDFSPNL